jgi:hypothetical protein
MEETFITLRRLLGVELATRPPEGVKRWFEILEPRPLRRDRVKTRKLPRLRG